MRGKAVKQTDLLALINLEDRIPATHPIRRIKTMVDEVLVEMNGCFDGMYKDLGRASVPPERLLKSKVLVALYSIRNDRQFCERLNYYDLLFVSVRSPSPYEGELASCILAGWKQSKQKYWTMEAREMVMGAALCRSTSGCGC